MKGSACSLCFIESYDMKSFLIATAIVFSIIVVGFSSYVGYRVSYSIALNDMSERIDREVGVQLTKRVYVNSMIEYKRIRAKYEARYGPMD